LVFDTAPAAPRRAGAQIMDTDPYYWTQDNGAGAPIHFATTYRQLDMARFLFSLCFCCTDATRTVAPRRQPPARPPRAPPPPLPCARTDASPARARVCAPAPLCRPQLHHIIRNCPEAINQRDGRGLTALHRAAFLAQYEGYMEIYEYLLVRAARMNTHARARGGPARRTAFRMKHSIDC
jgi:[acyl-carrier-protein] S-malonyltransferase